MPAGHYHDGQPLGMLCNSEPKLYMHWIFRNMLKDDALQMPPDSGAGLCCAARRLKFTGARRRVSPENFPPRS